MQINIGEVAFNTNLLFGSGTYRKFLGVVVTSAKRKKLFLICGIVSFQCPLC